MEAVTIGNCELGLRETVIGGWKLPWVWSLRVLFLITVIAFFLWFVFVFFL